MNSYRLEQLHVNITVDEYIEVALDPELEVIILSSYMQVFIKHSHCYEHQVCCQQSQSLRTEKKHAGTFTEFYYFLRIYFIQYSYNNTYCSEILST